MDIQYILQQCTFQNTVLRSMDGSDTQVTDWIDENLADVSGRTDQSDSENDVYTMRSSDDDLKLGSRS